MYSGIDDPSRWALPLALTEMAAKTPDAPWITDSAGQAMTFAEAEAQALRAASYFHQMGVRGGDRVGVFMYNGCDFVRIWLGLGKLGAVAVLFNTELRGAFLRHQINDSAVSHIVSEAELMPSLADLAFELPILTTVMVAGSVRSEMPAGWTVLPWRDFVNAPEWQGPSPASSDTACIMYTSGTSGPSKGVMMPHAHCALYGVGTIKALALTSSDRYYITLPLFHVQGLFMQLGATLLMGIPAFVLARFSASRWLTDIREQESTVTNLLGATASFVLAQPPSAQDNDNTLRAVLNGPNLPQHEAELRRRFGVQDVLSGFGMTEANVPIWGRIGQSAPGAAGWTHDEHFEVVIADPANDRPVEPGQLGEILIRPKIPFGFMSGYFNAPDKTVEAWRNLWFHSGDAGLRDKGRADHLC